MCVKSTTVLEMAVRDFLHLREQVGDDKAMFHVLTRYEVDRAEIIDLVAWRGEEPVCASV